MPPNQPQQGENVPGFKSQPWMVHDAVVAPSFLLGEADPTLLAVGTQSPALTRNGEMVFFVQGRVEAQMPWYTSLQQVGELSYGFEIWQMSMTLMFPPTQGIADNSELAYTLIAPGDYQTSGMVMMAHAFVYFGVVTMELGQENQMSWPFQAFGSGGGLWSADGRAGQPVQNGEPEESNKLKLPEPIQVPRTQALSAKVRLAPEVHGLIGTPAAPGVGSPIEAYEFNLNGVGLVELDSPPFGVRFVLYGRRIKKTQYGQLPPELAWINGEGPTVSGWS